MTKRRIARPPNLLAYQDGLSLLCRHLGRNHRQSVNIDAQSPLIKLFDSFKTATNKLP